MKKLWFSTKFKNRKLNIYWEDNIEKDNRGEWNDIDEKRSDIVLDPKQTDLMILSTLIHELIHELEYQYKTEFGEKEVLKIEKLFRRVLKRTLSRFSLKTN